MINEEQVLAGFGTERGVEVSEVGECYFGSKSAVQFSLF
jgi:hypothetical protein